MKEKLFPTHRMFSPKHIVARVATVEYFVATTYDVEGRNVITNCYLNRDLAVASVRGLGGWSANGIIKDVVKNVVIYDDSDGNQVMCEMGIPIELKFVDDDELRARALSKLTIDEQRALGLK